jgi:CheY-like chemotaxis protein
MSRSVEPITVLVVDDDPDDRLLARDLLREVPAVRDVRLIEDGEELFDYLHRRGKFARMTGWRRPSVILVDLYMPKKNGFELLAELKADPVLASIPVVVLTGSDSGADVQRAYSLGARSYMVKPLTLQRVTIGLRSDEE